MPLFFIYYFTVFCLGVPWWCGRAVIWRLACFGAALTWLWLGLKSEEELSHSPQWGSTERTLVDCLMGRFAWTNHIYIQITQPGSTVTPMYQYRRRRKISRLIESYAKCRFLPVQGLCGREKVRGAIVHKAGRKYPYDWLYLQLRGWIG